MRWASAGPVQFIRALQSQPLGWVYPASGELDVSSILQLK